MKKIFFIILTITSFGCEKTLKECNCAPPPSIGIFNLDLLDIDGKNITSNISKIYQVKSNGSYSYDNEITQKEMIDGGKKIKIDLSLGEKKTEIVTNQYKIQYNSGTIDLFTIKMRLPTLDSPRYEWIDLNFNETKVDFRKADNPNNLTDIYSASFRRSN
jgi:hypothetical protein